MSASAVCADGLQEKGAVLQARAVMGKQTGGQIGWTSPLCVERAASWPERGASSVGRSGWVALGVWVGC